MPDQNDSDTPAADPKGQPLPQSPMTPAAPQQGKMSDSSKGDPNHESDATKELAREFGIVEKFQIGTNLLLALVGIAALVIYNGQLKEMRKSTEAAKVAAQAASANALAAQHQFEIAQKAYETSEKSFHLDQRPYVTVAELSVQHELAYGDNQITLKLHNTGKTPAIDVRITPFLLFGSAKVPIDKTSTPSGSIIATNGIMADSFTLELTNQDLWEIAADKKRAVFHALITYTDIFKDRHTTKLCGFYSSKGKNFVFCHDDNNVE